MEITHHTQLLNALIEKHGLTTYLELGVQNPANNFWKITGKSLQFKEGVDPDPKIPEHTGDVISRKLSVEEFDAACLTAIYTMTSDEYFAKFTKDTFDLIFIDGLHHADQVKRDFENSLRCLSDNGFILIHDVLPENEAGTIVPRQTKVWWGDVYKWAMTVRNYKGIDVITYNIDNGCMVVKKSYPDLKYLVRCEEAPTWEYFLANHRTLMNVTDEVNI